MPEHRVSVLSYKWSLNYFSLSLHFVNFQKTSKVYCIRPNASLFSQRHFAQSLSCQIRANNLPVLSERWHTHKLGLTKNVRRIIIILTTMKDLGNSDKMWLCLQDISLSEFTSKLARKPKVTGRTQFVYQTEMIIVTDDDLDLQRGSLRIGLRSTFLKL